MKSSMRFSEASAAGGDSRIYCFGQTDSALDAAFRLYNEDRLAVWDSALAVSQTAGRGQMRRVWHSPPGNLYAALRLPMRMPFDGTGAAVAMGVLCALAFERLGCPIGIKWPNDLVCGQAKCGGILLEQRDGCLLAGIGINLAPIGQELDLREESALPAAFVPEEFLAGRSPLDLWREIVDIVISIAKSGDFCATWRLDADRFLLWKDMPVQITDGMDKKIGILRGIGENGSAVLETDGSRTEILGGSMSLAPERKKD